MAALSHQQSFMTFFKTSVSDIVKLCQNSGLVWFWSAQCYDWSAKKTFLVRFDTVGFKDVYWL